MGTFFRYLARKVAANGCKAESDVSGLFLNDIGHVFSNFKGSVPFTQAVCCHCL